MMTEHDEIWQAQAEARDLVLCGECVWYRPETTASSVLTVREERCRHPQAHTVAHDHVHTWQTATPPRIRNAQNDCADFDRWPGTWWRHVFATARPWLFLLLLLGIVAWYVLPNVADLGIWVGHHAVEALRTFGAPPGLKWW